MKYMTHHALRVQKFMQLAGQELPTAPCIPSEEVRRLRAKLILEEAIETVRGLGFEIWSCIPPADDKCPIPDTTNLRFDATLTPDLVEIADGCADISVVTIGTLLACGICDEPIIQAVDLANIKKLEGDWHRREDGKIVKPANWEAPDIAGLLRLQGWGG